MSAIDKISNKINLLNESLSQLTEKEINEKAEIQVQIDILTGCLSILDDEELMSKYDFSNTIKLLESYDYSIENLSEIISDIKNVLLIRQELNMSKDDIPLDEKQVSTFRDFVEKMKELKEKLEEKESRIFMSESSRKKIDNLESLKNILEGVGKRSYYTDDMFLDFYEEFPLLRLPTEEAEELLSEFFNTSNLKSRQKKEKANFDEVTELYKEFFPDKFGPILYKLNTYKDEIISVIDLDNTREILNFFKENAIIDKFEKKALLKISLYGNAEYIKNVIYPKLITNNLAILDVFFDDDLASIWIREIGSGVHRSSQFRRSRVHGEKTNAESLYSTCHTIDYNEFWENYRLMKDNRELFSEKVNIDDVTDILRAITMPTWVLSKNIELCKIFKLAKITPVPISCVDRGDIEDKIHLGIELGLLNPPLSHFFREIDKEIVKNDVFMANSRKKGFHNQSIRNYYLRYLSKLSTKPINEFACLFGKLQNRGYIGFYNEFFSDNLAGTGNLDMITPADKDMMKYKMNDFIAENFMIDWYSDKIDNYYEYNELLEEYTTDEKNTDYKKQQYIDPSILDDPLIQHLEKNNTVMDLVKQDEKDIEVKNEYVYLFGDRIISRYKVLHNASLLKGLYGKLTKEMLMTAVVRNSFIDEDTFNKIYLTVMEREKSL